MPRMCVKIKVAIHIVHALSWRYTGNGYEHDCIQAMPDYQMCIPRVPTRKNAVRLVFRR
jgi:hypothetical protein